MKNNMALKQRTVKGLFWTSLILFSTRGIGFITNIILSRILYPQDFGIVALALLAVNLVSLFQEFGMGSALVYEKEDLKKSANACFYLTAVNSLILCFLLYIFSDYIGAFFKEAALIKILKFLTIPLFISSLAITPQGLINKKMEFKKNFYPEIIPNIIYIIAAVSFALSGLGYFSIIYAYTIQICVSTVLYFIVTGWLPSLEFDYELCSRMFNYGKHLLGTAIIVFVSTNIDNAMIGKLIDNIALGYYYLAYNIANITATTLIPVINKVAFSLFCSVNKDGDDLKRVFFKVLEFTLLIIMPVTVGLFLFSPHLVKVIFGAKWMPIVVIIQILCWLGLLRAIGACSSLIFNAVGKTHLLFTTSVIFMTLGICLIYPFTKYFRQIGTAQAVIIQGIAGIALIFYLGLKIVNAKDFDLINVFKAPVLGCLCLFIAGYVLKKTLFSALVWYNLIALIVMGTVVYCAVVALVKKEVLDDMKMIVRELFG